MAVCKAGDQCVSFVVPTDFTIINSKISISRVAKTSEQIVNHHRTFDYDVRNDRRA